MPTDSIKRIADNITKTSEKQSEAAEATANAAESLSETSEKQLSTWGFIKIGFVETFQITNSVLKGTFQAGKDLWKKTYTTFTNVFQKLLTGIEGGIREVLGPLASAYDLIKDVTVKLFSSIVERFSIAWKSLKSGVERSKILQGIWDYFLRQEKKEQREGDDDKKKPKFGMLGILGLIAGTIVGVILAPLKLIWAGFKALNIRVKNFFNLFKNFSIFKSFKVLQTLIGAKIFQIKQSVLKFIKPITSLFSKSGRLFKLTKTFKWMGKLLGPFIKGFKLGFSKFFLPLTILIGLWDAFWAGWKEFKAGGSWTDIILAGIKGAIMGFVNPIIDIFGWVFETVLGWFGIEMKGTAKWLKDTFGKFIDMIIDGWKFIFKGLSWIADKLFGESKPNPDFVDPFDTDTDNFNKKQNKLKEASEEKQRLEMKKVYDEKLAKEKLAKEKLAKEKLTEENRRKLLDESKKQTNVLQNNQQTNINKQTTTGDQIPDELDGSVANLHLLWEF